MTNYKAYGLNLSKDIKDAIIGAHNDKTEITIGLNYNELKGNDKLMLTNEQIDKIRKAIKEGKKDKNKRGVTIIKISKNTNQKSTTKYFTRKNHLTSNQSILWNEKQNSFRLLSWINTRMFKKKSNQILWNRKSRSKNDPRIDQFNAKKKEESFSKGLV